MLPARPMSLSRTVQSKLVLPSDTNHLETMFGGKVLSYIDEIAAITAMKHCNERIVTASIDSVDFLAPVRVGDILELECVIISTGRTSLEVFVRVHSSDLLKPERRLTAESYLTMVAKDAHCNSIVVPQIYAETDEEKELFEIGQQRREALVLKRAK